MGKFLPVFLTFILQLCGVKIFRDVGEQVEGPLAATYIFLFAIFLLLWDIRLYPNSLRKLGLFQYFVEFLIAQFLFENILLDFWFPLEVTLLLLPLELASTVEEMLTTYANLACGPLCEGLRDERAGLVLSYVLSVFFLIAVLHATRAIDLRELECGLGPFFAEIVGRLKRWVKRVKRSLGIGQKRRVKIKETNNQEDTMCPGISSTPNKSSKSPPYCSDRASESDFSYCDETLNHLGESYSDFEMSLNS